MRERGGLAIEESVREVEGMVRNVRFALNTWVDLPGGHGCMVRFVHAHDGEPPHCFYSFMALNRLVMEFWGGLYQPMIVRLSRVDIIAWCPLKYCWPWCVPCQKFLLPVEEHRASMKHRAMLQNTAGMDGKALRALHMWKVGSREPLRL